MVRVRKILPQIAQNSQNLLLGITSHRLHRSTQMLLISGWCTSCLVGALETSAPPWRHPNHLCRSVNSVGEYTLQEVLWILCNLWENNLSKKFCEFCEICGRTISARSSVNSVKSVGGTLMLRRQGYLRYYLRTLTICVNLWNLWENIRSKKFCEFCEICGRIYAVRVKSVGEYSQQRLLWDLRIRWEDIRCKGTEAARHTITARRECHYHIRVTALHHRCNVVTRSW